MKRTLIFMACILASVVMQAQEESNDYMACGSFCFQ